MKESGLINDKENAGAKRFYFGCAECDGEVGPRPMGELATTSWGQTRWPDANMEDPKLLVVEPQNRDAILSDRRWEPPADQGLEEVVWCLTTR